MKAARALANKYNAPLLIHLSETKQGERRSCSRNASLTPTQLLDSLGVLNGRTLAAHGVWVNADDMRAPEAARHGRRALPVEQHEAGERRRAGNGVPEGGCCARAWDRWSRRQQQRFQPVRRDGSRREDCRRCTTMDPTALRAEQAFEMATITRRSRGRASRRRSDRSKPASAPT